MAWTVRAFLFGINAVLLPIVVIWQLAGHFDLDLRPFPRIIAIAGGLFALAVFYTRVRKDERLAAMLYGVAFLMLFAPLCNLLIAFSTTIAGPRIDGLLAAMDRSLGVDYRALIALIAAHPRIIDVLGVAYGLSAYQMVAPMLLLGFRGDPKDISRACVATAICALTSIAFWVMFPSFGAYTVYDLQDIAARFHVGIDAKYPAYLNGVLIHGPGRIDPDSPRGLIGFPSFHTEEILLSVWYLRKNPYLLAPVAAFSVLALLATPIQGGHHIVDLIGGGLFAAFGIWAAGGLTGFLERLDLDRTSSSMPAASP